MNRGSHDRRRGGSPFGDNRPSRGSRGTYVPTPYPQEHHPRRVSRSPSPVQDSFSGRRGRGRMSPSSYQNDRRAPSSRFSDRERRSPPMGGRSSMRYGGNDFPTRRSSPPPRFDRERDRENRDREREQRDRERESRDREREQREQRKKTPSPRLIVKGLSRNVEEAHLQELFEKFGKIVEAKIEIDSKTKYHRGTAFVEYSNVEEATKAIDCLDEGYLDGKILKVEFRYD